ncbi:hypothetical protein UCRPC4_g00004 [Phaeomoniella chlamydospora]|uniref:Wings apart-like protein C-terminal domain-containing protein n=1 Tax=Phaeomoniella chlamydospora TaxID=158046 RepID=A0A0G2F4P1_PHACM|nr:hypothetical protein UCRPC4_g00004 [Phaeomoniella chlamydospora]
MAAPRRKIVTYGKRSNKGHDFFNQWQSDEEEVSPIRTPPYKRDIDTAIAKSPSHDAAMFDVPSSDEEGDFIQSARKRRRLTPVSSDKIASDINSKAKSRSAPSAAKRPTVQDTKKYSKPEAPKTTNVEQRSAMVSKKTYARIGSKPLPRGILQSPSVSPASTSSRSASQQPLTPPKQLGSIEETIDLGLASCASIPTPEGTPNRPTRVRNLLNDKYVVDSPSQLGLARLQLASAHGSPEESSESPERNISNEIAPQTKRKLGSGRSRLIDALGPADESFQEDTILANGSFQSKDEDEDMQDPPAVVKDHKSQVQPSPAAKPAKNSSSQPLIATGPKMTYAKQRSYLSDAMIDVIPPVSAIGSSQRSQTLPPSQGDSFDMLDTDEDAGAGGIRSIHELRKAGGAVRFQENLDAIFEDIASTAKGRRIVGYIQLGNKLGDPDTRTQFTSHAMDQRFTKLVGGTDNILELSLQCVLSALLLHDGQASSRTVQNAISALLPTLTPLLLQQNAVDSLASNRIENLSKATRKDLTAFNATVLQSDIWSGLERPTLVTPQLIALRLIDVLLCRVRDSDDARLKLPLATLDLLVDLLLETDMSKEVNISAVCRTELLVSILESYTIKITTLDNATVGVLTKLAGLGSILQVLSGSSEESYRRMHHLVLRLILNITNNNVAICDALSQPQLLTAVLQTISQDFLQLSPTGGNEANQADFVILSLGIAINLAEMSQPARKLIANLRPPPSSTTDTFATTFLEQFVSLFVSTLDEEAETGAASTTVGEGQNLVAFGYITVLLSTLCVEQEARNVVKPKLPDGNLQALRTAMRDFVVHWKKVDDVSGGEFRAVVTRFEEVALRLDQAAMA